mgnify:CR=1 FL=1|tara:strand:- start:52 stop:417 length:366 start_codon:yes stop_codon:yes gene_type:complete
MGRGASAKMNHAMIRQAVFDVLSNKNAIKYEDFKEQITKQYVVLTGQKIVNRDDWRAAWRRCANSACKVLNEETDWLKINNRILTNIYIEGKPIIKEEYELVRPFILDLRNKEKAIKKQSV